MKRGPKYSMPLQNLLPRRLKGNRIDGARQRAAHLLEVDAIGRRDQAMIENAFLHGRQLVYVFNVPQFDPRAIIAMWIDRLFEGLGLGRHQVSKRKRVSGRWLFFQSA